MASADRDGESGCVKSTLATLLVKLVEPTAWHIRFGGQDLGRSNAVA
jgi:ABC-type oligopeptide transport system ATPase subunit